MTSYVARPARRPPLHSGVKPQLRGTPILDAFYLASSWTWCIGMFLPALLLRDYGWWGFVVFAVPNVVGAAAMGWVLRPGASEAILARHRPMCEAFSLATIAFQAYFILGLVFGAGGGPKWAGYTAVVAGLVLTVILMLLLKRRIRVAGAAVWCVSIAVGIWLLSSGGIAEARTAFGHAGSGNGLDLLALAPVCCFGFALCPYLDLTFHRVRRENTTSGARTAFTLGFGVLFFAMILITCLYAPWFTGGTAVSELPMVLIVLVGIHLGLQAGYTELVHTVEAPPRAGFAITAGMFAALLATVACKLLAMHGLSGFEVVYRVFMSLYGLVFPAYVWLIVIPTRDGHSGMAGLAGRAKLRIFAVAVGVAIPMYAMGFIARHEIWLFPGLGIVMLARLFLPRGRPAPSQ